MPFAAAASTAVHQFAGAAGDFWVPLATGSHPVWILQWEEVLKPEVMRCSVALFAGGILCSAAGIGGGGVYVSVLMVLGRLSPRNAVPLSKAIVFFGSVSALLVNMRRALAQNAGGPVLRINLDACRLVVPAALVGTFLGVLLNWHTRDTAIVFMLCMMLLTLTCMVLHKARLQRSEEAAPAAAESAALKGSLGGAQDAEDEERVPLLQSGTAAPLDLLECRRSEFPKNKPNRTDVVLACWLMLIVVCSGILHFHMRACREELAGRLAPRISCKHPIAMTLLGGRLEVWMSNESTSVILQLLTMSTPLWSCFVIAAYYAYVVMKVADWKIAKVFAYQGVATVTGLLSALIGIGGGLILSPFFLLTGMEPAVAVGTSATCVLFTSASTTFQYAFTDRIIVSLALVYGVANVLASYVGTSLVHHIEDNRSGRRSYITLLVAGGVALSAMLSLVKFAGLFSEARSGQV